jgi:transposase
MRSMKKDLEPISNCRGLSIRYKCGMIRLSDLQWERIRHHFPEENIADGRPGRRPVSTRQVLEGTLWILNTGAQWHMLPQCYPNYKTVHRRFQTWCRSEVLRGILMDIANELRERGVLDEEECFIDATFVMAKGGGAEVGPTKRGKGIKIMAIVDRHGLPLSVSTHAANHHEVRLVQLCFDFYMIEAKPENLIGDRAYDSDPLDHALGQDGIEMIAPHRSNRTKPPTQDRRRLRRFLRRWLVERFFAWIQWQRRILVRWEYHPENFLGFVQLACLVVLFRRF